MPFTESDWRRIRADYAAWWNGDLDRPLVCPFVDPSPTLQQWTRFMSNWPADWSDDRIVATVEQAVAEQRCFGDTYPFFFVNFGPGVGAAFLGAHLHSAPDTVWFEPPVRHELSDLRIRPNPENPWRRRIHHLTQLLAARLADRVQISVSDIGGNLDILASLRGSEPLLTDLIESPETVKRLLADITTFWIQIHRELHDAIAAHSPTADAWARLLAPGRMYMLQSDFAYMISPAMFEEFVLPDLRACCDYLEYPFYHMDGPGQVPHLDHLCALKRLRGIQWVPGTGNPPPSQWPHVLGRIRDAGKLCQAHGTPDEALEIVRRFGGKGFQFMLNCADMTEAAVRKAVEDITAG